MSIVNSDIKVFINNRSHISGLVSKLSNDQFFYIPAGYKTNLIWNVGHLVSTSQILFYNLSGLKPYVSEEYLNQFRKGSSPLNWVKQPEVAEVLQMFSELADKVKIDYEQGLFLDFKPYATSVGVKLEGIDDALAFNNFHDGIHTGIIQCMVKLL